MANRIDTLPIRRLQHQSSSAHWTRLIVHVHLQLVGDQNLSVSSTGSHCREEPWDRRQADELKRTHSLTHSFLLFNEDHWVRVFPFFPLIFCCLLCFRNVHSRIDEFKMLHVYFFIHSCVSLFTVSMQSQWIPLIRSNGALGPEQTCPWSRSGSTSTPS